MNLKISKIVTSMISKQSDIVSCLKVVGKVSSRNVRPLQIKLNMILSIRAFNKIYMPLWNVEDII